MCGPERLDAPPEIVPELRQLVAPDVQRGLGVLLEPDVAAADHLKLRVVREQACGGQGELYAVFFDAPRLPVYRRTERPQEPHGVHLGPVPRVRAEPLTRHIVLSDGKLLLNQNRSGVVSHVLPLEPENLVRPVVHNGLVGWQAYGSGDVIRHHLVDPIAPPQRFGFFLVPLLDVDVEMALGAYLEILELAEAPCEGLLLPLASARCG
jgi:hypothetical protein